MMEREEQFSVGSFQLAVNSQTEKVLQRTEWIRSSRVESVNSKQKTVSSLQPSAGSQCANVLMSK